MVTTSSCSLSFDRSEDGPATVSPHGTNLGDVCHHGAAESGIAPASPHPTARAARADLLGASSKNNDLAFRAVDPDPVAGVDTRASVDRSDYRWKSHFPSHDRSVACMAAMVGDDRSDEMQD